MILYSAPVSEENLMVLPERVLLIWLKKKVYTVEVRPVLVSELVEASKMVTLKEIFGAGTAAVVNPIIGFSYQEVYYELPKTENSYAVQLKDKLTNIQHKLAEDTFMDRKV
jgi:branched-chain amino acid aminotransferase